MSIAQYLSKIVWLNCVNVGNTPYRQYMITYMYDSTVIKTQIWYTWKVRRNLYAQTCSKHVTTPHGHPIRFVKHKIYCDNNERSRKNEKRIPWKFGNVHRKKHLKKSRNWRSQTNHRKLNAHERRAPENKRVKRVVSTFSNFKSAIMKKRENEYAGWGPRGNEQRKQLQHGNNKNTTTLLKRTRTNIFRSSYTINNHISIPQLRHNNMRHVNACIHACVNI